MVYQPLADDGVGLFGQPRLGQQVADVHAAHFLAVEQVLVFARAVGAAGDFDFGIINGQPAVAVVEGEGGLGHAGAGPFLAPREDHVGGFFAAQGGVALFAEDPAHGIGDVAFAAPVGTDDGRDAVVKHEFGFAGEGFVPLQNEFFEFHRGEIIASCGGGWLTFAPKWGVERAVGATLVVARLVVVRLGG